MSDRYWMNKFHVGIKVSGAVCAGWHELWKTICYVLFLRVTVIFQVSQTIVSKPHMAAKALYLKSKVWCSSSRAQIMCEWWVRFRRYQWWWRQWLERSRRWWWCPVTDRFLLEWAARAKTCTSGSCTPCVIFLYFFLQWSCSFQTNFYHRQ